MSKISAATAKTILTGNESIPLSDPLTTSPRRITTNHFVEFAPQITALTGGASNALDSLPTAGSNMATGRILAFLLSGELVFYQLQAGTTSEASPGVIRPDDFHITDNQKVWVSVK